MSADLVFDRLKHLATSADKLRQDRLLDEPVASGGDLGRHRPLRSGAAEGYVSRSVDWRAVLGAKSCVLGRAFTVGLLRPSHPGRTLVEVRGSFQVLLI